MSTYERHVLDNGLRVLTAPVAQAQSVTCMIMLAAGSRYETPDTNGIAHFSEHMFFKGTERRPSARQIAGEIDAIGGEFNAFTGKEYTAYYVKCAAEHRNVALDVIVDMRENSTTCFHWFGAELSEDNGIAMYVPKGFAHGYQTLTDGATAFYMVSSFYAPEFEGGLRFDDQKLSIEWPRVVSDISEKDAKW